jgi:tRNA nucleotidyltransferase/poly(A) polymerase
MKSLFSKYIKLREESEEAPVGVTAKIKLQKKQGSNEFTPFIIDKDNHANLAPLIGAFLDSDKVGLGYTTIDRNKGEIEPQLKKKSIFLTGGAVRDHLLGKTPKNYDLVTDATASEIRMILKYSGFKEVKGQIDNNKYDDLPNDVSGKKIFYVSRTDKKSKELEIVAVVKGQPFRLSSMTKSPKSRYFDPSDIKLASSVEEDAINRDFTINAMYIPLTNDDGPNSELIDPFGGAHHLKSGEMKAVGGKFEDRMQEDPMTAFRLVNHFNRFGKGQNVPEEYLKHIGSEDDYEDISPDKIKDEFVNGLENPDVNAKKFLKTYHSTGLLDIVFPNIHIDIEDVPNDMRCDRWMAAAWILRNNNPTDVKDVLIAGGWSKQEASDIAYLVRFYQWGKSKFDINQFYNMIQSHTGLTKAKIREWMHLANMHGKEVDQFLHFNKDDLNSHNTDEFGNKKINPIFIQFLGREPVGSEPDEMKKILMTKRWKEMNDRIL